MNPDPFVRTSFWMVSTGLTSMWISNVGVTPECIQRFMAIPKLSDAVKYKRHIICVGLNIMINMIL